MTKPAIRKEEKCGTNMFDKIMSIYALVILCVFPLVYHNYYFDILETKYKFYCGASIVMIITMLVYGLYTNQVIEYLKGFTFGKLIKSLNIVDWMILLFWFANVLSWVLCQWPWEAFWGTSGRYNGVFLTSIYTIVYFLTTRFLKFRREFLDAFLLVSIFVCLFGITDYFKMDLLGFKERMLDSQKAIYTSTFGNINTYTVYVGAVLCVSMLLFTLESCMKRTIAYALVMAVAMVALIVGASDNAYLSLAALFGFAPLYLFKTKTGVRRYMIAVAMFLTAVVFVGWINTSFAEQVYGLSGIFGLISKMSILPLCAAGLWGIAIVMMIAANRNKASQNETVGKWLRWIWMALILLVVSIVIFVLYDANIAGNAERYGAIQGYVVFNDTWGTNRGYVWIRSVELFKEILTPIQKIFGYGADTFKLLMMQYYQPQDNVVFDSAHNEYLHFLLTIGIVGVGSYIAFLVSAAVRMIKSVKEEPMILTALFVLLAYATQALVNINLPVVFPLIFQLISMGLSLVNNKEK